MIQKVRPEVFHKTDVSKHFRSSRPFRLRSATLLKMRLWHRCFPMNFVKFLRMPYFTEQFRWLLLTFRKIHRKYRCWSLFSIKVFPVNFVKIWKHLICRISARSSCPEVFVKKVLLEVSQNSQENTCARASPANIRLDEDVLKTSWRHLSSSFSEDVFKTSWSRPIYLS